jgi:3-deoxy-D-manno-octulosonate 8-phosphate phosphatase (KDO 8-P phosphatase)
MDFKQIKLLLMDVDGVLTDGSINLDHLGRETKRFHVRDGMGIVAWRKLGLMVGILTGRPSVVTTHRATELGIDLVSQGAAEAKLPSYENLCKRAGVSDEQVAFIGDDIADLPVLRRVAYPMTVADGVAENKSVAKYVTKLPGGHGAVREAIEHLLRGMGRWDEVLDKYNM